MQQRLERMGIWHMVGEEPYDPYNKEELRNLANELREIEVVPSIRGMDGCYHPDKNRSFTTGVIEKMLKRYSDGALWGAEISLYNPKYCIYYSLGKNITFIESSEPRLIVKDIGRSYLAGLLYIIMKSPKGDVYYARIERDKETGKLVAHLRPAGRDKIDENSEIIAIIKPLEGGKKVKIITSAKYLERVMREEE